MAACIDLMAEAFAALATGKVYQPLRTIVRPPDAKGMMGLMAAVRPIQSVRVASLNRDHAQQFARETTAQFAFPIEPVDSVQAAVREADVIVAATTSPQPILQREWISDGTHINAIGAYTPTTLTASASILYSPVTVSPRGQTAGQSRPQFPLEHLRGRPGAIGKMPLPEQLSDA